MRAEFLRGKRKEETNVKEKRKYRKEDLGLRVKSQRKGVLWARKEHKEIEGRKLKGATKKEMKRNQGVADQENHYKRKGVDLHYPCQPTSHMRRLYKQKRELPHPKFCIYTSQSNHTWDQWGGGSFFTNDNINFKSRSGLSWANASVPLAPLPLPLQTPSLAPLAPSIPSLASPPTPLQTPHYAKHTPRRLSVITSTRDIETWNEVKP